MYTFKTDFSDKNTEVHPDDMRKLLGVSLEVAQHVFGINLKDYSSKFTFKLGVSDSLNGNIYFIYNDFNKENDFKLTARYSFKFDANNELYLYNTKFFILNYKLLSTLPTLMNEEYPDSININFYDDFKIYDYEISYRKLVRHFIDECTEDDAVSVVDFIYTVRNNKIDLKVLYNYSARNHSPETSFKIHKSDLSENELRKESLFYTLLKLVGYSSILPELFPSFKTKNLINSVDFKQTYIDFINDQDEELILNKIGVIEMERI